MNQPPCLCSNADCPYKRWWEAIDELGVVNWTPVNVNDPDPYEAIGRIVAFDTMVALDPAVSREARALYQRGRQDGIDGTNLYPEIEA